MALKEDVIASVDAIIAQRFDSRDGQVVPETDAVKLAGGAVRLDAAILYADLADSTELVMKYDPGFAAKVMKAFLAASSRIIREYKGEIRSFDGDRVMAIFVGDRKETRAATTALKINWAVLNVLRPRLRPVKTLLSAGGDYVLQHSVGVDTGPVVAVLGGMRAHNDLVWIGRAPNVAAKLSTVRESPYHSFVTPDVYKNLAPELKATNQQPMWEARLWATVPAIGGVYRSSWTWTL